MDTACHTLATIGGEALSADEPKLSPTIPGGFPLLREQLTELLALKNGFYAFESALRVFPVGRTARGYDLEQWNSTDGWRQAYGELAEHLLFFAEDLFGDQFALASTGVLRFNAETGRTSFLSPTVEGWAELLLRNYEEETGYPLAHQWQLRNGPLAEGQRLMPKRLFIMGGPFTVDNLLPVDAATGMRFRGEIAAQIKDLPDGATVDIQFTDE
jgi:hypothetical protein